MSDDSEMEVKPKSKSKISYKDFINAIKLRPHLWNPQDPGYTNYRRAAREWTSLSRIFGVKEVALKKKWKNLRDSFRRLCKLSSYVVNGQMADSTNIKWVHFKRLWFLYPVMHPPDSPFVHEPETTDVKDESHNMYEQDDDGVFNEIQLNPMDIPQNSMDPINIGREDSDIMFLKSLAPFFKDFTPVKNLTVRNKIMTLILNEMTNDGDDLCNNGF